MRKCSINQVFFSTLHFFLAELPPEAQEFPHYDGGDQGVRVRGCKVNKKFKKNYYRYICCHDFSSRCRAKEATMLLMEHLCGANLAASPRGDGEGECGEKQDNSNVMWNMLLPDSPCPPPGYPAQPQQPPPPPPNPVSMNLEISPQHHAMVLGRGNLTLKLIMQRTNTTILFPDAADPNIPSIRYNWRANSVRGLGFSCGKNVATNPCHQGMNGL